MKMTKRIMAVLLAVFLLAALAVVPASAADISNGQINITKGIAGDVYKAYKILTVEDGVNNAFRYMLTGDTWKTFVGNNSTYFTVTDDKYVTGSFDATVVGAAAMTYVASEGVSTSYTATVAADGTASITGLGYGYYLVLATYGTDSVRPVPALVSILPGKTTAEIQSKNTIDGLPSIEKFVDKSDNGAGTWAKANDAAFGDTVNFKIEVTVDAAATNYVVTDTLPAGMSQTGTISVKHNGVDMVLGTDYTVSGLTFTFTKAMATMDTIEITYSATMLDTAVVGATGNVNNVTLTYDKGGVPGTPKSDHTTTFTYSVIVNKTDGSNPLVGATFALYEGATLLESIDGAALSTFTFDGLDAGTYTLKETVTPKGYVTAADVTFTVTAEITDAEGLKTLTTTQGTADRAAGTITHTVVNVPGTELPSTGGVGTTIFYMAGLVLVLAAVTVLVTKKRANG